MIGQWAKATLGDKAKDAKIATLDLTANQPTVDYLRHNGFLTGFGIPVKDPKHFSTSDSPQIVGSDLSSGSDEGGRTAMEKILQKADHIDLVYAINEPAADGGYAALKAAGKEKGVLVVAVDGGCNGIKSVKQGVIGATSQQYPLLMASDGVEAVAEFIKTGKKPKSIDTGEKLVTDHPGPRRALDQHRRRHEALLGLIFPAVGSLMSKSEDSALVSSASRAPIPMRTKTSGDDRGANDDRNCARRSASAAGIRARAGRRGDRAGFVRGRTSSAVEAHPALPASPIPTTVPFVVLVLGLLLGVIVNYLALRHRQQFFDGADRR